jgi:flagellar biosynthesis protein FliR
MTLSLAEILPLVQASLWSGFVVFLRIGAMLSLVPAFGEQSVPVRVKLALALAFTLVVLPAVTPMIPPVPELAPQAAGLVVVEAVNGLLFGLMLRFFILALQIAGAIAAQSTSLSQLFGGGVGPEPQPAIGHILIMAGLALVALLGLHVRLAAFMIESYDLILPGTLPSPQVIADAGLREVTRCFGLAFTLAAPFVIASLIYNVTLGVINRAMPQLMVAFIGAPAITAGGLILLMLSAPVLLTVWSQALFAFMDAPFGALP